MRLAGCFLFVALATAVARCAPGANHLIWIANGVLLAYLLMAPRRQWTAYLIAALAAQIVGSIFVNPHWQMNLLRTALNLAEVLISAYLLRRRSSLFPRFTDHAFLFRFIAFGVLAGPLVIGSIYTLIAALWLPIAPAQAMFQWVVPDALGAGIATPACVAMLRIRFRESLSFGKNWIYLFLLAAVTLASFTQTKVPLVFFLYPLLLLVLYRLGLGWAAMATLFVAGVGSWYTMRGQGLFAMSNSLTPFEPTILLQVFLVSGMFVLYSVSVVLESRRATERRLQKIAALHMLVTQNSRDAIILADFEGNRSFVSPSAKDLAGCTEEELAAHKSIELVHPEDRVKAAAAVRELRSGAEGGMLECRIRKQCGEYIWVESSLRVVRDSATGAPTGILNMVRDITERKNAEIQLQDAFCAVEALSITDALTGLANRRGFDQCLATEWRRGLRDSKPLSLLMVDADLFKPYNDLYGHLQGDNCLKQIAEVALDVVTRPGDLVARFGGEGFAIILPNTFNKGAMQIAHKICAALRDRKLPHKGSPPGIMTVSAGCATMVPSLGQNAVSLVELADAALYKAKRNGRDQVCRCNAVGATGGELRAGALSEASIAKTA
ncbi:MAG: diguanylate cyclase [Terracidiphilus sp.]